MSAWSSQSPQGPEAAVRLRKGSRVHSGFGAYVDTRRTGLVLDAPGDLYVLVQWDGRTRFALESLSGLRNATEPCAGCQGIRQHKKGCRILAASAIEGHEYVAGITRSGGTTCRTCGRSQYHRIHGSPRVG